MIYKFVISGRLKGLNEYIEACRKCPKSGGSLKRKEQSWVVLYIKNRLRGVHISRPVIIHYHWYEPNRKRDLDNIAGFGHKVIQDALVECGVLANDGWKEVCGFTDVFSVTKKEPYIAVEIEEVID